MDDNNYDLNDDFKAAISSENIEKLQSSLTENCIKDSFDKAVAAISGFVPVIGALKSSVDCYRNYRDSQFVKKIINFLYGLSRESLKDEDIQDFYSNVESLNKENVSSTILNLLDRIDNQYKAVIIGNIMRSCVEKNIKYSDFLRLCSCIERVPYVDLEMLKLYTYDNYIENNSETLFSSGLITDTIIDGGNLNNGVEEPVNNKYGLTKLGELLLQYGFFVIDYSYKGSGKQNPNAWGHFD